LKSGRLPFLGGLAAGATLLSLLLPSAFDTLPATFTLRRAVMSGILVGMGSSMGNGCTSGHGICGMSRMSKRSFLYTYAAFPLLFFKNNALGVIGMIF
jgi:uncharacterized membrane protein YedE/YeeE